VLDTFAARCSRQSSGCCGTLAQRSATSPDLATKDPEPEPDGNREQGEREGHRRWTLLLVNGDPEIAHHCE
jgi:hypothetical protein